MVSHWEDSDAVAQEMFANVRQSQLCHPRSRAKPDPAGVYNMCLYCLCCTDVLTMWPPPNTSAFIFNYYDTHFSTMERRYPTIVSTHGLETKQKIEASIIEKGSDRPRTRRCVVNGPCAVLLVGERGTRFRGACAVFHACTKSTCPFAPWPLRFGKVFSRPSVSAMVTANAAADNE